MWRKVIPFRMFTDELQPAVYETPLNQQPPKEEEKEPKKEPVLIEVMPGESLPAGYVDYRPYLQRDGLILFCWEIFGDDIKIVWFTSNGNSLRYQAWLGNEAALPTLCPEHRYDTWKRNYKYSYKEIPDRIVYAAPSGLTLNTRDAFISKLRQSGISVDFSYKFTLGGQKIAEEKAVADKIMKCPVSDTFTSMNLSIQPLLDAFIGELYEEGTVDRWNLKKPERVRNRRRDIMLTAWGYRKQEGLSMSDALKRAWNLARYFYAA